MSSSREQVLEASGLRLRFTRHGDRFAHEIWVAHAGRWQLALASVEGTPDDEWPASGPFQSLHVDARDGQAVALLVGMAGRSHWSASAQIEPSAPSVTFDVACRVRSARPGFLGSSYRATDVPVAVEPVGEASWVAVEREGDLVRVAVQATDGGAARTVRWGYRVRPLV